MIREEVTDQTIRAIPAIGGAVTTALTLNEWVALATLLYIVLQIIILLHKHYYFVKTHKFISNEDSE